MSDIINKLASDYVTTKTADSHGPGGVDSNMWNLLHTLEKANGEFTFEEMEMESVPAPTIRQAIKEDLIEAEGVEGRDALYDISRKGYKWLDDADKAGVKDVKTFIKDVEARIKELQRECDSYVKDRKDSYALNAIKNSITQELERALAVCARHKSISSIKPR